jgi:hypothetical protein
MTTVAKSFHWDRNVDNTLDGAFPNGDKPPEPVTLAWNLSGFPSLNLDIGTPFSTNLRAYLSGTQAATATITLSNFTGDNPTTEGWVAPGTGSLLTHPGTGTGSGTFAFLATGDAGTVLSASVSWQYLDPAATEFPGVVVSTFNNLTAGQLTADQDPVNWISGRTDRRQFIRSTPTFGASNRCSESFVDRDDPINTTGERCELRFGNPTNLPTQTAVDGAGRTYRYSDVDWWWGYAVYQPSAYMQAPLYRRVGGVPSAAHTIGGIFSQMHRTKDSYDPGSGGGGPWHDLYRDLSGTYPNQVFHWRVRADVNPNTITDPATTTSRTFDCGAIVYDTWTKWVFQCRYNALTGFLRVWKSDTSTNNLLIQVVDVIGGVGFRDANAPYLKWGVYIGDWDMTKFSGNLYVTTANVEKRQAQTFFASWRWYYGNNGSTDHVLPR